MIGFNSSMEANFAGGSTILIVDDTPSNLSVLFDYLNESGFKVLVAEDGETALEQVQHVHPDLILLDVMMEGIDGYETCRRLKAKESTSEIPVIFLTALSETHDKVLGFQVGGVDYITKPLQHEEVLARVQAHLTIQRLQRSLKEQNSRLQQEIDAHHRSKATVRYLNKELKDRESAHEIIGKSSIMIELLDRAKRVAATESTVLIEGETGSGKEVLAHYIHHQSERSDRPFVKIDCTSIRKEGADRELFGVEKGAFNEDTPQTMGRFELADGGTVFLDEISELPLPVQGKILRVLQDQEFERVGGTITQYIDIRIIAATQCDLNRMIEAKSFREDLYYRLNVFPLRVPPLRQRKEDIRALVEYFFDKHMVKLGNRVTEIDDKTMEQMEDYDWPGNIRELENTIERALILSAGPKLEIDETAFRQSGAVTGTAGDSEEAERAYLLSALERANWVIGGPAGAARILGIDSESLRERMQKIGIVAPETKGQSKQRQSEMIGEQAFQAAVKDALQCYIETDRLRESVLLNCAIIENEVGYEANIAQRIDQLRNVLKTTAELFAKHPKTTVYSRVLHRTYFEPAVSQELAAEALNLGYSTYRRHLSKARSLLTAELWQLEHQHRV